MSFLSGSTGQYGLGASGGKAGTAAKGGCGEYANSCDVNGRKRSCQSYVDCTGKYKGKDCEPNSNGRNGQNGRRPSNNAPPVKTIKVDTGFLITAGNFHLDMLMKYALYLANQETIDESQEILVFLTKFDGQTGALATKMLEQMGSAGQLEATTRPIDKLSFDQLNSRLTRTISRGQRIEDLLNTMGDVFEFTAFFRSVQDTILSVCEEELSENRKAQEKDCSIRERIWI